MIFVTSFSEKSGHCDQFFWAVTSFCIGEGNKCEQIMNKNDACDQFFWSFAQFLKKTGQSQTA